ncbi:DUF4406 domain-containing protein [Limnobaculum xujianqingii]|uniref:DUF4406 domain-containing protein n=1 Tax=Limnobaculum xujianqingii TaxID=2738837 RepID=UPI0011277A49|nr:DUF4406 domain-containing protein [Limnobaculum xujianqingii]
MSDKKPVVFISGPMTGIANFNRTTFNSLAEVLEEQGFVVLNPAVLPDGLAHEQYMKITLAMLEEADVMFLLDGWDNSKGAKQEFIKAKRLELLFMYESNVALKAAVESSRHFNAVAREAKVENSICY